MKSTLLAILATMSLACGAQTYSTPELRQKAEAEAAAKNAATAKKSALKTAHTTKQEPDAIAVMPDVTGFYRIVSIEAVNFGSRHSEVQKAEFRKEAKSEIELNNFYLNPEKTQIIKVNRKTGRFHSFKLNMQDGKLVFDCALCNIPPFSVVAATATTLTLLQPAQDENQTFEFKYEFKK
jgi:hypothetical protein